MSLDFNPIELLTEELGSKQREARLRAVRGLPAVAMALGQAGTRSELMKLVEKFVSTEDEDEVLFELSKLLGDFAVELGGAAYIHLVFEPLRILASTEETVVRVKAAGSLCRVFDMSDGGVEAAKIGMTAVAEMAGQEGLGAKVSAAMACPAVVRLMTRTGAGKAEQEQARTVLKLLLKDESQMVRRAAASELEAMCVAMANPQQFAVDFVESVRELTVDTQDIVRLAVVEQLGKILGGNPEDGQAWSTETARLERVKAEALGAENGNGEHEEEEAPLKEEEQYYWTGGSPALAVLGAGHADASWRVRESLAAHIAGYARHCNATAPTEAEKVLSIFATLVGDHEIDVRVAALGAAPDVAEANTLAFGQHDDLINSLVACGAEAPEQKVRMAAATALTRLVGVLAPSKAAKNDADAKECLAAAQRQLFSAVESKLFVDEHVEVMLATLGELAAVVQFLDPDNAARVAAFVEQTEHENWRVRRVLTLTLPAVAQQRTRDAFEMELLDGYLRTFQDRIGQVRYSAVEALELLRELRTDGALIFEGDWLMEKIAKRLSEVYLTMSYYLYRITIVQAFEKLCSKNLSETHMETVVLFLVEAARDEVPNVRFTAVCGLETASKYAVDRLITSHIKPIYNELAANDDDQDVRIATKTAMAALQPP